ncbi:MAG: MFS transporter [Candidatus Hermodarchaeota archaeon]
MVVSTQVKYQRSILFNPITLLTSTYALFSLFGASALVLSSSYIIIFYLNHISYAELGILFAISTVCIAFLDFPTGTLADTIGTKKVLVVAYISFCISWIVLFISNSFFGFVIAIVIAALGHSQLSGTLEAWYANRYKQLNGDMNFFRNKLGKISSVRLFFTAALVSLGGILANFFGILFVFICQSILCGFTAILALIIINEPSNTKIKEKRTFNEQYTQFKNNLTKGLRTTLQLPIFLGLLIGSMFAGAAQQVWSLVTQPALLEAGSSLLLLGIIFSLASIANGLGYFLGGKFPRKISEKNASFLIWLFVPIFYALMFLGSEFSSILFLFIGILGYSCVVGMYNPNMGQWYHKIIPDQHRTALLSLRSTIRNFVFTLTFLFSGVIIELSSKSIGFFMALIISFGTLLIIKILSIHENRVKV